MWGLGVHMSTWLHMWDFRFWMYKIIPFKNLNDVRTGGAYVHLVANVRWCILTEQPCFPCQLTLNLIFVFLFKLLLYLCIKYICIFILILCLLYFDVFAYIWIGSIFYAFLESRRFQCKMLNCIWIILAEHVAKGTRTVFAIEFP